MEFGRQVFCGVSHQTVMPLIKSLQVLRCKICHKSVSRILCVYTRPIHEVAEVKSYLYEVLPLARLTDTDARPSNEATAKGGTSDGSESDVESNSIYENVTSTSDGAACTTYLPIPVYRCAYFNATTHGRWRDVNTSGFNS